MPFGMLILVGPGNHILDKGQNRTNPFAATMGDKSVMPLFDKLLGHLFCVPDAQPT